MAAKRIILATGRLKTKRSEDHWTLEQQLDETAISVSRAALANNLELIVPLDKAFAPVVAQIALQYPVFRPIESESPIEMEDEEPSGMIPFVRRASDERSSSGGTEDWLYDYVNAGHFPERALANNFDSVEKVHGESATLVALGADANCEQTIDLAVSRWPNLRLVTFSKHMIPNKHVERAEIYLDDLRKKLNELSSRIDEIPPWEEEDGEKDAEQKFVYDPHILRAQLLIGELLGHEPPQLV